MGAPFNQYIRYLAQSRLAEQEAQRQQARLDRTREYVGGLLGQEQQMAPAGSQAEFQAFNQIPFEAAGQMTPEQQVMTQQGKGLIGGEMSQPEFFAGLLSAPTQQAQELGAQGLLSMMVPQQSKATTLERQLASMGMQPGTAQWNKMMRKAILKPGTTVNVGQGGPTTPGFEKVDKNFAQTYVDWKAAGGFSDVQKNLGQLQGAISQLQQGGVQTGPLQGFTPDMMKSVTNPKLLSLKQNVEEVVQRNLRLILGAQFTEKEGERLIERAFDPKLPPEENIARLQRLINQIRRAAIAKQEAVNYFDTKGTLQGFKGETFSGTDFKADTLFGDKSPIKKKYGLE